MGDTANTALPSPSAPEVTLSTLDGYTNEELYKIIVASPRMITTRKENVRILSGELVAKFIGVGVRDDYRDEVVACQTASFLGINVPTVRRVVPWPEDEGRMYMIMDRIHGLTLEQKWPSMSLWETVWLAWQLRGYLRSMRSLRVQQTGGLVSGTVRTIWIEAKYRPMRHASPFQFTEYLNSWIMLDKNDRTKPQPAFRFQPEDHHTFVHQDLAPRNMIADGQGRLWLVDWGFSGYYPSYMERAGFVPTEIGCIHGKSWASWWANIRWQVFWWISWGGRAKYGNLFKALNMVLSRSMRFRKEKASFCEPVIVYSTVPHVAYPLAD